MGAFAGFSNSPQLKIALFVTTSACANAWAAYKVKSSTNLNSKRPSSNIEPDSSRRIRNGNAHGLRKVHLDPKVFRGSSDTPMMNISGTGTTSLLDSVLNAGTTRQEIGVAILKKAQDTQTQEGE